MATQAVKNTRRTSRVDRGSTVGRPWVDDPLMERRWSHGSAQIAKLQNCTFALLHICKSGTAHFARLAAILLMLVTMSVSVWGADPVIFSTTTKDAQNIGVYTLEMSSTNSQSGTFTKGNTLNDNDPLYVASTNTFVASSTGELGYRLKSENKKYLRIKGLSAGDKVYFYYTHTSTFSSKKLTLSAATNATGAGTKLTDLAINVSTSRQCHVVSYTIKTSDVTSMATVSSNADCTNQLYVSSEQTVNIYRIKIIPAGGSEAPVYYYRGLKNSWNPAAMTDSEDGLYAYIDGTYTGTHQFKICVNKTNYDGALGRDYTHSGFNSTNVTNMNSSSSKWGENTGTAEQNVCIYRDNGNKYYVIVYYPNTTINSTSSPKICASTTLPYNPAPAPTPPAGPYDGDLYILGENVPLGWSADNPTQFTKLGSGNYVIEDIYLTHAVTNGFKMPTVKDWQPKWMAKGGDKEITTTGTYDIEYTTKNTPDYKFLSHAQGHYKLVVKFTSETEGTIQALPVVPANLAVVGPITGSGDPWNANQQSAMSAPVVDGNNKTFTWTKNLAVGNHAFCFCSQASASDFYLHANQATMTATGCTLVDEDADAAVTDNVHHNFNLGVTAAGVYKITVTYNTTNNTVAVNAAPVTYTVNYGLTTGCDGMGSVVANIMNGDVKGDAISNGTQVISGAKVRFEATPNTGYHFVGWCNQQNGTGQFANATSVAWNLGEDANAYAKFAADQYTLTYKDQGDAAYSGSNGSSLPTTHTYGAATALVDGVRAGYIFDGWYTSSDCTGDAITSIAAAAITANTTLYAKWTEKCTPVLTWAPTLNKEETTVSTNSKSSSDAHLTNLSNITVTDLTVTSARQTDATNKIQSLATRDASKYVSMTFDVESGYKFTPSVVSLPTTAVSNSKTIEVIISDATNSESQTWAQPASASPTPTEHEYSFSQHAYTGTVTLKIMAYGDTKGFRLGTPITICGEVEEIPVVNYYIKHPFASDDWTWKQLADNGDGTYSITDVLGNKSYTVCNLNTTNSDSGKSDIGAGDITWVGEPNVGDKCVFSYNPSTNKLTITKVTDIYHIYLGQTLTLGAGVTATYDATDTENNVPARYYNFIAGETQQYAPENALSIANGNEVTGNTLGKYKLTMTGGDVDAITVYVYRYYAKYPWGACSEEGEAYNKMWKWAAMDYAEGNTLKVYGLYSEKVNNHSNLGWDYYYDWDGVYKFDGDAIPNLHPGLDEGSNQGVWIDGTSSTTGGSVYREINSVANMTCQKYIKLTYEPAHSINGTEEPALNADNFLASDGTSEVEGNFKQLHYGAYPAEGGVVSHNASADKVEQGTVVTFYAEAAEGYIFRGWYNNATCTGEAITSGVADNLYTVEVPAGGVNAYAKFEKYVTSIELHSAGDINELGVGQTLQLTVTYDPDDATYGKSIESWVSDDENYLRVNGSGLVTAVAVGSGHYITATTSNGKTATYNITVISGACEGYSVHMWNAKGTHTRACLEQSNGNEYRSAQVTLPSNSDAEQLKVLYQGNHVDGHSSQWTTRWLPMIGKQANDDVPQIYPGQDAVGYFRIYINSGDPNYYLAFQPTYVLTYGVNGQAGWQQVEFREPASGHEYQTDVVKVPVNYFSTANFNCYVGTKRANGTAPFVAGHDDKADRSEEFLMKNMTGLKTSDMGGHYGYYKIFDNSADKNWFVSFVPGYAYELRNEDESLIYVEASKTEDATHIYNGESDVELPTKTGYTLIGWNRAKNQTTADLALGAEYTLYSSLDVFYPVWEENDEPSGDCTQYISYAASANAEIDGNPADNSTYAKSLTGDSNIDNGKQVDFVAGGSTYKLVKRSSSATLNTTLTIPSGFTGVVYTYAKSSSSSAARTFTATHKTTSAKTSGQSIGADYGTYRLPVEGTLDAGEYTLATGANVNMGALVVELCPTGVTPPTPADAWALYHNGTKVGDFAENAGIFTLTGFVLNNDSRNNLCFKNGDTQYYVTANNGNITTKSPLVQANNNFNFNTAPAGTYDITITKENGTWYVQAVGAEPEPCTPVNATITFNNNKSEKFNVAWVESDAVCTGGATIDLSKMGHDNDHSMTKMAPKGTQNTSFLSFTLPDGITKGSVVIKACRYSTNSNTTTLALKNSGGTVLASKDIKNSTIGTPDAGSWTAPTLVELSYNLTSGGTYSIAETTNKGNVYIFEISVTASNDCECTGSEAELAYGTTAVNKTEGDAAFVNTLTNPHSVAVTYTSTNTSVATVAADGTVTIVGAGSTTIKAASAEQTISETTYCADEVSYTLTVAAAPTYTVTVNDTETTCSKNTTAKAGQTVTITNECEVAGKHLTGYTSTPEVSGSFNSTTGTYTFTMPASDVTLTAVWVEDGACTDHTYKMMWRTSDDWCGNTAWEGPKSYVDASVYSNAFTLSFNAEGATDAYAREKQNSALTTGKTDNNWLKFVPYIGSNLKSVRFYGKVEAGAQVSYSLNGTDWVALDGNGDTDGTVGDGVQRVFAIDLTDATELTFKNISAEDAATAGLWIRNMELVICGEPEPLSCPIPVLESQTASPALPLAIGQEDLLLTCEFSNVTAHQWYSCDANGTSLQAIAGATGKTLTLAHDAQRVGIYYYVCKATNRCSAEESQEKYSNPIVVEFIPAEVTIKYTLTSASNSVAISEHSSSSAYVTESGDLDRQAAIASSSQSQKDHYTCKLVAPASEDPTKYTAFTFTIDDGCRMQIKDIYLNVQAVTCDDQEFRAVLQDESDHVLNGTVSKPKNGTNVGVNFGETDAAGLLSEDYFTGNVTLKVWGWDLNQTGKTYRLGTTVTITGIIETLPQPELHWVVAPANGPLGRKMTVSAASNNCDGTITYTSETPSVATVDASGELNYLRQGTAAIKASITGDGVNTDAQTVTISTTITVYPATYIVTLDPNVGSVSPETISPGEAGESVLLPAPSYAGKTFEAWYTEREGGTKVGEAGDSYTPTKDITLYAHWIASEYNVTFVTNGGTINSGKITSYEYGVGATLPTDVTKADNTFDGWYVTSDFTGSAVTKISATASGDKTYYAKWTPLGGKTPIVVWNTEETAYKGQLLSVSVTTNTDAVLEASQLTASEGVLSGVTVKNGTFTGLLAIPTSAGTITLTLTTPAGAEYAASTETHTITVPNDCPGAGEESIYSMYLTGQTTYEVTGGTATTAMSSTATTKSTKTYYKPNSSNGVVITLSGDQTFAVGDVVTIDVASVAAKTVGMHIKSGSTDVASLIEDINNTTATVSYTIKAGDPMIGKNTITLNRHSSDTYFYGVEITRESAASTQLVWSNAQASGAEVAKQVGDAAFTIAAVANTTGAISYESSATGVATVSASGEVTLVSAGTTTITATVAAVGCYATESITYTLKVAAAEAVKHTVTLIENGGVINEGNITEYAEGVGAVLPINVTKNHYTFAGWYAEEDFSGSVVTAIAATATTDLTFYAKWTAMSYEVEFDMQGHGTQIEAIAVEYNQKATAPATPVADGYEFQGWYKENTFKNLWDFATEKVTANVTLYAKWRSATSIYFHPVTPNHESTIYETYGIYTELFNKSTNIASTYSEWAAKTGTINTSGSSYTAPSGWLDGGSGKPGYGFLTITNSNTLTFNITNCKAVYLVENGGGSSRSATLSVKEDGVEVDAVKSKNGSAINTLSYTGLNKSKNYTVTVSTNSADNSRVYQIRFETDAVSAAAAPIITTQPATTTYCEGETIAALTVAATVTDGGTLSYQWYKGSTKVGEDSNSYLPTEAGTYKCVVTNSLDGHTATSATSANAVVTINSNPAITTQPSNVTVEQGNPATLTVEATSAGEYLWQSAASAEGEWSAAAGTNNAATYTVTPASAGVTYYRVIVSGDCGADVTSKVVSITALEVVTPCFSNDAVKTLSSGSATVEYTLDGTSVLAAGTIIAGQVQVSDKSKADLGLLVNGVQVAGEVTFAANKTYYNFSYVVPAKSSLIGSHTLTFSRSGNTSTTFRNITVTYCGEPCDQPAPKIILQSDNSTGCAIDITYKAVKNVDDSEYTEGSFQWYKNDEAIAGATEATYNVTAAGVYTVEYINDCEVMSTNSIEQKELAAGMVKRLAPFQYYHYDQTYTEQMKMRHLFAITTLGEVDGKAYQITATNGEMPITLPATAIVEEATSEANTINILLDLNALKARLPEDAETIVIKGMAANSCGEWDEEHSATIDLKVIDETPTLAFVVAGADGEGTKNKKNQKAGGDFLTGYNKADLCLQTALLTVNKEEELPLYTSLKDEFLVTPVNGYADFNKYNYEPFDLVFLTDFVRTDGSNNTTRVEKALDNMRQLVDYRPLFSTKAHMIKKELPSWADVGFGNNPVVPKQTQKWMNLVCESHPMFANIDLNFIPRANENDEYIFTMLNDKGFDAGKGLQGFNRSDVTGLVEVSYTHYNAHPDANNDPVAEADDKELTVTAERQVNGEARMILMSINADAHSLLTGDGIDVIKSALHYLLRIDVNDQADCSVVFDNDPDRVVNDSRGDHRGGDGLWSNPANWDVEKVPDETTVARLIKPCTVDIPNAICKTLKISTQKAGHEGHLTINANAALQVMERIYRVENGQYFMYKNPSPEDIEIKSNASGNGALIHGDKEGKTGATVEHYSIASGAPNDCKWQWFATPFTSEYAMPNYEGTWVTAYTNSTHLWNPIIHNNDPIEAFKGYEITRRDKGTMTLHGTLATTANQSLSLYNGLNVIGNSWTAPINIAAFTEADFENAEATIVMFNTGLDENGVGSVTSYSSIEDVDNRTPGTYVSIPVNVASSLNPELQVIPSLQSYQVRTDKGVNGTLTLDYDRLVRTSGAVNIQAMRAPGRQVVAETNDNGITDKLRIYVQGSCYGDYLYIFRQPETTMGFDNGWDGRKYLSANTEIPAIVVRADALNWQISTQPQFVGTQISFYQGKDTDYTMGFQYDGNEQLWLYDSKTDSYTEILNENTYSFSSTSGRRIQNRFMITDYNPYYVDPVDPTPGITTGIMNLEADGNSLTFTNTTGCEMRFRIYDASGKACCEVRTKAPLYTVDLPATKGVYMVDAQAGDMHIVRKVVR